MKRILLVIVLSTIFVTCYATGLGYALSGGGARGFAHIGILKVLEEEGIKPDYVTGTSIGAIIGSFYALGYTAVEIESLAVSINWDELMLDNVSRGDLYVGQKRWTPFGNAVLELDDGWNPKLPTSLYRANSLNLKLFELYAPASNIRDFNLLPIAFSCVATNLQDGTPKIFNSGSLMQAVRASLSVPSLMQPFRVGEDIYIDGGISQNLPIEEVKNMGADKVVAIKVNSSLRKQDKLDSMIDVLDQTINIGITSKLNENIDECDLLLEPNLQEYTSQDFKHAAQIIQIGEEYARSNIQTIRSFIETTSYNSSHKNDSKLDIDKHFYRISRAEAIGNKRVSLTKIKEYLGLEIPGVYSAGYISQAFRRALNSQFFTIIYPELIPDSEDSFVLKIHVHERQPKSIALNNAYNNELKLTASAILSIDNILLKNSRLLTQVILGGKNELNIDYVKNFGEFWGIYYRIFPFINEKTLYSYNDDHFQVSSSKSLEWGATSGIGVFTYHNIIAEAFLYYSNTSLYRGISETDVSLKNYHVSGYGFKAYYESLDEYMFPHKGVVGMGKFNFSFNNNMSDFIYSNFKGKTEAYIPINNSLSLHGGISVGSYFKDQTSQKNDPFTIGGMDGFKGYSLYEISAPYFRIMQFGINSEPFKNIFIQAGIQGLSYSDEEFIGSKFSDEYCYYAGIGIRPYRIPMRLQFALNERDTINTMFSIGYDADIFQFSRK
ncbi:MAG: patatin-like phospholipase family protein [Candidatus Cloacimonadaceae bacterium]|nr:patatin-like phospholipase family protein [Candidatus Cloacimonadaceae bacterium]